MSDDHDDIAQRVSKLESNQQEFNEKLTQQRDKFDEKLDMHKKKVNKT